MVNKKPTQQVQFFTEIISNSEDLDELQQNHYQREYDNDELEEKAKEYHNQQFFAFIEFIEKNQEPGLKFESPYMDKGFWGAPKNSNQYFLMCQNSLISVIEKPFVVLPLQETEIVSIQRLGRGVSTFDVVFIMSDYKTTFIISNI